MPIDDIFYSRPRESATEYESLRNKMISLTAGFTENELCFAIEVMKGIRTMNYSRGLED